MGLHHCIIYKYGFLHVSITLHCECDLLRVCTVCVCFCTYANTFSTVYLYLRPGVPSLSCVFVHVCRCIMCMLTSTLCLTVLYSSVNVLSLSLCVCICVCVVCIHCMFSRWNSSSTLQCVDENAIHY